MGNVFQVKFWSQQLNSWVCIVPAPTGKASQGVLEVTPKQLPLLQKLQPKK